jgi:hypothetical protein
MRCGISVLIGNTTCHDVFHYPGTGHSLVATRQEAAQYIVLNVLKYIVLRQGSYLNHIVICQDSETHHVIPLGGKPVETSR